MFFSTLVMINGRGCNNVIRDYSSICKVSHMRSIYTDGITFSAPTLVQAPVRVHANGESFI